MMTIEIKNNRPVHAKIDSTILKIIKNALVFYYEDNMILSFYRMPSFFFYLRRFIFTLV